MMTEGVSALCGVSQTVCLEEGAHITSGCEKDWESGPPRETEGCWKCRHPLKERTHKLALGTQLGSGRGMAVCRDASHTGRDTVVGLQDKGWRNNLQCPYGEFSYCMAHKGPASSTLKTPSGSTITSLPTVGESVSRNQPRPMILEKLSRNSS